MSRPLRIEYPGAWYHVMNRGLARQAIFHNDHHRKLFLELLNEICQHYKVEIHAYCLMGNHYHLFLRTPLGNLSRAMRHLNGIYTQRYNQCTKRDGPLFRGRYKSILVDADVYLLRLSRYIHLNPVAAHLIDVPEHYTWSSYAAYLNKHRAPPWLMTTTTLDYFGKHNQRQNYKAFVEEGIDKELLDYFKKLKRIPILGSEVFQKTVSEKYLQEQHKIIEIPAHKEMITLPTLDEISAVVSNYYQIDSKELTRKKRGENNIPRRVWMYVAQQHGQHNHHSIANYMGDMTTRGVSKSNLRLAKKQGNDPLFRQELQNLESLLSTSIAKP